jgi:ABC-type cobalamin/Fe3+-siderophores transport system ATPase subunit
MTTLFDEWKQYLSDEDISYLRTFVNNLKNNLPNDKMIILSGKNGRNGKTTLIKEIIQYIGENNCHDCAPDNNVFSLPIKPLVVFNGIESYHKKQVPLLINIITYKQSIIADTNRIEKVDTSLLEVSKVINMFHEF